MFAIFTSQAWNMAFSFYQSLRSVPTDLDEVSQGFALSPMRRFLRLDLPFATPALVWNAMMSMSGGWFFVVASEAITVGNTTVTLPGIGSWLAIAIQRQDFRCDRPGGGADGRSSSCSTTSCSSARSSPGPTASASNRPRAPSSPGPGPTTCSADPPAAGAVGADARDRAAAAAARTGRTERRRRSRERAPNPLFERLWQVGVLLAVLVLAPSGGRCDYVRAHARAGTTHWRGRLSPA